MKFKHSCMRWVQELIFILKYIPEKWNMKGNIQVYSSGERREQVKIFYKEDYETACFIQTIAGHVTSMEKGRGT